MQKITFQASQVELSAVQSNDIYMSVLMRMFSTRPKLNFEAVVNYAGNAFCEKSWDMIEKSNPFNIANRKNGSQAMSNLAGFFGKSSIRIMGGTNK